MGTKTSFKIMRYKRDHDTIPGSGPQVHNTVVSLIKLDSSRFGESNPFYKSKIARGETATTSLVASKQKCFFKPGNLEYVLNDKLAPNYGLTGRNTYCGLNLFAVNNSVLSSIIDNARNSAAIGIRTKIQKQTDNFSGLTFLGELRESIHMIRHPAAAMRELTGNFLQTADRRYRQVGKKHFGRAISGSWLEYAFGVAPLMNDIAAIAQSSLARIDEDRIIRLSYTGHDARSSSSVDQTGAGSVNVQMFYSRDEKQEAHVKYIVGYKREVQGSTLGLQNIIDQSGFRLDQVIPTAWELLPWSFFIDYFSNIGSVISSHLVSLSNVAWSQQTTRTKYSQHWHSGKAVPGVGVGLTSSLAPEFYAERSSVERVTALIPYGNLRFELPGRSSQFLNLSALAALQFIHL